MTDKAVSVYDGIAGFWCSILMALGLTLSGVVNPKHIRGFFQYHNDASLIATFLGGVLSFALIDRLVIRNMRYPLVYGLFGTLRNFPPKSTGHVGSAVILGSIIFGVGWAFSGFSPGPALLFTIGSSPTASSSSNHPLWFTLSMFLGMAAAGLSVGFGVMNLLRLLVCSFAVVIMRNWHPSIDFSELRQIIHSLLASLFGSTPEGPSFSQSLFGGSLIGISLGLMFILSGVSLGTSGAVSRVFSGAKKLEWYRLTFFFGLLISGKFLSLIFPEMFSFDFGPDHDVVVSDPDQIDPETVTNSYLQLAATWPLWMIFSGFLVGFGTSVSNGCTVGHGILGVARLSPRSIFATIIFFCIPLFLPFFSFFPSILFWIISSSWDLAWTIVSFFFNRILLVFSFFFNSCVEFVVLLITSFLSLV